ncbi:MAG: hypothetical protein ACYC9L_06765 [Sulfuricaulis sp.]
MVKLRFFAAGTTRLCQIEANGGTVTERTGNLSRTPGRPTQWKTKIHPPSIVAGDADAYVAKLVEARVREGYQIESNEDSIEDSRNQLHLVVRAKDPIEQAPLADALVVFGAPPMKPVPGNRMGTCEVGVGGVVVSFERFATGTNVTAVAAVNHAKLAALFLCIAKIAGAPCQASDANAVEVDARELVDQAIADGKFDEQIVEHLYQLGIRPRPFNVSQLTTIPRRRFTAAM